MKYLSFKEFVEKYGLKNDPIPKKKLSKQNQEFMNKISASGFKQSNLCEDQKKGFFS